jgi:hypothetical protein
MPTNRHVKRPVRIKRPTTLDDLSIADRLALMTGHFRGATITRESAADVWREVRAEFITRHPQRPGNPFWAETLSKGNP